MRLSTIKLVGFKSFVEPTKIPFPDQMTCVVGPNGCGKSNVIDAVRWVLGESSAKNLRGDAMTDVIFNGSTSRKPISQASVELIFDNTQDRLADSFASRNQVSIKRSVNREGMSFYYLNGSKCRKRDITDIFLGTGLGPRSYAIIEQGMISRLIESKPHELRVFIEEAAGVSKYKERRRETETRIRSTRENLERLLDVRQELQAQLDKLSEQSSQAKLYSQYKTQERCLKSELSVLKWQKLQLQIDATDTKIKKREQEIAFYQEAHIGHEDVLGALKNDIEASVQHTQSLQELDYKTTTELTRFETQKVHLKQKKRELNEQNKNLETKILALETEQKNINGASLISKEKATLIEGEFEIAQLRVAENQEKSELLYLSNQDAFKTWQTLQESFHEQEKKIQKNKYDIEKISGALALNEKQVAQCKLQLEQLNERNNVKELEQLKIEQIQLKSTLAKQQLAQNKKQLLTKEHVEKQNEINIEIDKLTQIVHQKEAKLKALNDIVNNAFSHSDTQCKDAVSLLSQLKVENGFELVVENALQQFKHAQVFENTVSVTMAGHRVWQHHSNEVSIKALSHKVNTGVYPDILERIALVENDIEAKEILKDSHWFACINKQGTLFGRNWKLDTKIDESASLIVKSKKVTELKKELSHHYFNQAQLEKEVGEQRLIISELNIEHDVISAHIHQLSQQDVAIFTRLDLLQEQTQHWQVQFDDTSAQLNQFSTQNIQLKCDYQAAQAKAVEITDVKLVAQVQLAELDYSKAKQELKLYQEQLEQLKNAKHESSLALESIKNTLKLEEHQLLHNQAALAEAHKLQKTVNTQYMALVDPIKNASEQIAVLLNQKQKLNVKRSEHSKALVKAKENLSIKESGQKDAQNELEKIQKKLQQLEVEQQGSLVRAAGLLEPLVDLNTNLETVLKHLPENAKLAIWQTKLDDLAIKVNQLGPINLAAIDEYEKAKNRKEYLDEQYQDLFDALNTLETAIHKIDKETKNRFKETFDALNEGLKELFPKVFGGGHAYLELTSNDLLESGVTIMARPPGKKNSTIHLLSGGEKALTALSLVFSIFRLNPAPFCMLDEVDAPLDDANVGRFCKLVEEMSQTVQFIYISHNKIAMEMAGSLVGVTMGEPGVSRMVAVDIDQAVEMAVN
ncbi:chromosome segregation protein SMC [Pseudoalteromonas denitrificans]|uniref:Chromosome partition protein Smc n=1 Tax=Pseudoalteromonas denitrificans DSM 6059 TaxID=1123010 RepID=A0A1I1HXM6_9GAMM|nr:chromosome segregation protein SMC [Pseudoalteromonas denitrificans]SFC28847.1 condensin subunit Smc [Pseudoalteromonas denitrificans DSM 6059]